MNWRRTAKSNTLATFSESGWKSEWEVLKRQQKSVWFVIAGLITLAAFWTNLWAWVVFFSVLAAYSALNKIRIGFICGLSFALWFAASIEGLIVPLTWQNQVAGLWCIGTLFLVIIWKADAVQLANKVIEQTPEEDLKEITQEEANE